MSSVPYVDLPGQFRAIEAEVLEAVRGVLHHGQFILGPEVAELEMALARFLDVTDVVTVSSGTHALVLSLRLRGIGVGDEVLLPSHSFIATAYAVSMVGARPVFVDIEDRSMLLDPTLLEAAMTDRTKAVMPVHLGGHPCDMRSISGFCQETGLELIEDCAQAIGTRLHGRSVGSYGLGCFSLHPLKTLAAAGDAGFISVQDEEDGRELRLMRNFGFEDRDHSAFISDHSRLDTLQAAILLVKMRQLEHYLEARKTHASAYERALGGAFRLVEVPDWARPSYSTFVVRHKERDRILAEMIRRGFDLKIHYPVPIHRQTPYWDSSDPNSLPITDGAVSEIMSLPVSPELAPSDRDDLIHTLLAIC